MQSGAFRDGFGRAASRDDRRTAILYAAALGVVALTASCSGRVVLVHAAAFAPIAGTFAFCAFVLTTVLLTGQFYVTGAIGVGLLACAYEIAAVFGVARLSGAANVPDALGTLRDVAFAALVTTAFAVDPRFDRCILSRIDVGRTLTFGATATFAAAAMLAGTAWLASPHVPSFALLAVTADALACAIVIVRGGRATRLAAWIAIPAFAFALESVLSGAGLLPYSLGWYLARLPSALAATAVAFVLLREIAAFYKRLADLATRDALTGLPNRRGLDEYMRSIYSFARRRKFGFALLVVDIDHFKRYNDHHGHALGDIALRRVAGLLRKSAVRRHDYVARFGGEEFVVALCDVTVREAIVVAERLQKRIDGARIPHAGVSSGRISVSVGIGNTDDASRTAQDELFEVADRALYQAKERGRNRYVVATCAPAPAEEPDQYITVAQRH